MKQLFTLFSILTLFFFTISCGNNQPSDEEVIDEVLAPFSDDANSEVTAADTSSTGVYQEEVDESEGNSLQDALQANKQEILEEGGLSFCDCIKKQKTLTDLMLETEDDAVLEKAMAELEGLKMGDCKMLFAIQQNTIEEKQAHERKVKQCLKK